MRDTNEAEALALQALVWTLQDERRAERFLALTGLDADGLRASLREHPTMVAVIEFLEGNEADLIACAAALEVSPVALLGVHETLK